MAFFSAVGGRAYLSLRRAYDYWQDQPGCYAWLGGENLDKSRNSYRPTHAVPLLPPREGQEVDHIIGLGCPPCVLTMMAIESNASKAPKIYFGTPTRALLSKSPHYSPFGPTQCHRHAGQCKLPAAESTSEGFSVGSDIAGGRQKQRLLFTRS